MTSQDWQLSTAGPGLISEGGDDIAQCLVLILTTEKGSDPLCPSFGCDAWQYVDRPLPVAVTSMTRAIIDAVNLWEPRVVLKSVNHSFPDESRINFRVGWQLVDGETSGEVTVVFGASLPLESSESTSALATFINPTISPVLVKSQNWQLSLEGQGRIVQGLRDIGQSILLITSTMKGSDPLRPTFGCDLFDFIDQPLPVAGPAMASAIRDAVNLWEPRVTVLAVRYSRQDEHGEKKTFPAGLRFEIGWRLRGGTVTGQTGVILGTIDDYLNDVLNPVPGVPAIVFILATENLEPITTEDGNTILIQ